MASRKPRARSPYYNGPPRPPTARQRDFLRAVRDLWAELGSAPNATQVAAQLGIRQTSARQQLKALEKRGFLRDIPKEVSSGRWRLTDPGLQEIGAPLPEWHCGDCGAVSQGAEIAACPVCGYEERI